MVTLPEQCAKQIDELLGLPHQSWLLGAGISKESGIPLMHPLTSRVAVTLENAHKDLYKAILDDLPSHSHVEHVLSHVGDLIAIAERGKTKMARLGNREWSHEELRELHADIQRAIRDAVRFGYIAPEGDKAESVGNKDTPIVTVDKHVCFVEALFHRSRAGLERRPPVSFFTTNYDTLLEDALALTGIPTCDGFSGGAMAFWDPSSLEESSHLSTSGAHFARLYKLHGSIDWFSIADNVVIRLREGAGYPKKDGGNLLIYPQATKYQVTQRDPFASLFAAFRRALCHSEPSVLVVCGYSFGDDHINEEIARALAQRGNRLTVLAFVEQPDGPLDENEGLPAALSQWLGSAASPWSQRIVVVGRRGVYHGSTENRFPTTEDAGSPWWTFSGVTRLLRHGPGAM